MPGVTIHVRIGHVCCVYATVSVNRAINLILVDQLIHLNNRIIT